MPSHDLNQCWNIVNLTIGNKFQWNLNQNLYIFIQGNVFENVIWKMSANLSQPLCVNVQKGEINILTVLTSNPALFTDEGEVISYKLYHPGSMRLDCPNPLSSVAFITEFNCLEQSLLRVSPINLACSWKRPLICCNPTPLAFAWGFADYFFFTFMLQSVLFFIWCMYMSIKNLNLNLKIKIKIKIRRVKNSMPQWSTI